MIEDRDQKTEVSGQMSVVSGQMSEVRRLRTDIQNSSICSMRYTLFARDSQLVTRNP